MHPQTRLGLLRVVFLLIPVMGSLSWASAPEADGDLLLADPEILPLQTWQTLADPNLVPPPIKPFEFRRTETFAEVIELVAAAKFRQAFTMLERMEFSPNNDDDAAEYWYWHGMALMGLQDYDAAGISFMRIVVFHDRSLRYAMTLYRLAEVHERLNRYDVSGSLYRRIIRLPSSVYVSESRVRAERRLYQLESIRCAHMVSTLP